MVAKCILKQAMLSNVVFCVFKMELNWQNSKFVMMNLKKKNSKQFCEGTAYIKFTNKCCFQTKIDVLYEFLNL